MIDIFIPVYNEKDNIKTLLDELKVKVHSEFRALIVYDLDDDNTLSVLQKIINDYTFPIIIQKNSYGRGAINAFLTAIDVCTGDYLIHVMADLADDLATVDLMREKLDAGYDVVVGSRYMKDGARNCQNGLKPILSRMGGVGMHFLTGIPTHDISNAYRMYRVDALRNVPITTTVGHGGTIEILLKMYLAGYTVTEIPDVWNDRVAGESQFRMGAWVPKCVYWCLYTIIHKWFFGEGKPQIKHSKKEEQKV